jgi:hypothetical protein
MTVLSAVQNACRLPSMGIHPAPTTLFTSTDQQEIQLCNLANECAQIIAKAHDWRKLTTLKTQAGDGATTAFSLPADFDRMPVNSSVFLTSTAAPLARVEDTDQWLALGLTSVAGTAGAWFIIGGTINVKPAVAASTSIKFYYQSNLIVDPASGDNKTAFTLDSDAFMLNERLLTSCLQFKWRSQNGLDYQQELSDFNMAMGQEVARDKGSRILHVGRARMPSGVTLAYPGTVGV